jgi:hypothetical protein
MIELKLLEFRQKSVAVKKNAKNLFFKNNYADINSVIESITPVLNELGLVFTQCPNIKDGMDVLTTRVIVADDPKEFIESNVRLLLPSADMQKLGSAITYARRYALISMFGLETEDDDGNMASGKVSKNNTKTPNKAYNKTPTQALNERVNNAFEILDKAKKDGDIATAKKVFKQAESENLIQVQDRCINLFGDKLD